MKRTELEAKYGWPRAAERGVISEADDRGFRREVAFEPGHAWSTRGESPARDYGRASVKVRHLLHGPLGTVQFLWSTGITPERVPVADSRYSYDEWMHHGASGSDVGYHADAPQYEDQSAFDCEYRPGGKCYYDGSGLAGDEFLATFLTEGEDAMWAGLEARYVEWFGTERSDASS